MTGRWTVGLATGALFAVAAMGAVALTGHYPRTGDPRLVFWFADVLAAAVAVRAAARIAGAAWEQGPAQRVAAAVFVGLLFGAIALFVIVVVVGVGVIILVAIGLHHHAPGGAF